RDEAMCVPSKTAHRMAMQDDLAAPKFGFPQTHRRAKAQPGSEPRRAGKPIPHLAERDDYNASAASGAGAAGSRRPTVRRMPKRMRRPAAQYGQTIFRSVSVNPSIGPRIRASAVMLCPRPRTPPCSLAEVCRDSSDCRDGVTDENPMTDTGSTRIKY